MHFASQFVGLTNGLSDRLRIAAEMLMIGVAYQETGTVWSVYSIEGDDIGKMSTFMVSQTACMLKKQGLRSNHDGGLLSRGGRPYLTFAHDPKLSNIPDDVIQEMLTRRFRNPVTLM